MIWLCPIHARMCTITFAPGLCDVSGTIVSVASRKGFLQLLTLGLMPEDRRKPLFRQRVATRTTQDTINLVSRECRYPDIHTRVTKTTTVSIVDDRPNTGFASFFGKIVSQKTSVWYFLEYRYSYRFWGIWDWWYFPKYYVTDFNSPNSAPTRNTFVKV